jgi:aspartyl aminopeptidase
VNCRAPRPVLHPLIPSPACCLRAANNQTGNPQWSMHSIRETSGTADLHSSHALFVAFFNEFRSIDDSLVVDAPATAAAASN